MAKAPKEPKTPRLPSFGTIRSKIREIFNLIRISRIVLKHLEACLGELFSISGDEIEPTLPATGTLPEPSTTLVDPEMD
jgi:hypothetical protein